MTIKELETRLLNLETQVAALGSRRTIGLAENAITLAKRTSDKYESMKEDILEQNLAFESLMTEILPEVIGGEE